MSAGLFARLRSHAPAAWPVTPPPLGDAWHVPPAWLAPLAGDLDERRRRDVSRVVLGAVHSALVHAERRFIAAARARLARGGAPHAEHLAHLVREETAHAAAFEAFAVACCGGLQADRVIALRGDAPCDALLLGRLVVLEEIVDAIDLAISREPAVHPAVRALHAAHHADESRHLAFGRVAAAQIVSTDTYRRELAAFAAASWRAVVTTEPFVRAGLPHPVSARDLWWDALAPLRRDVAERRMAGLARRGVIA